MKLSNLFLFSCIAVLLMQSSCKNGTEPEETLSGPIVGIYPFEFISHLPDSIRALQDFTKTPTTLYSILLPNNCPVSFAIANIGSKGSILKYTIADDGALGGFLDYTNGTGSLEADSCATITVSVKSRFAYIGFGSIARSTLVLNVYTPKASNHIETSVRIRIESVDDEAQKLCGIWSGTWPGKSYAGPLPTSSNLPVSGTWILNLQSVDLANKTASGTLTWNGSDAYWENNPPVSHALVVNRTLIFNSFNADLTESPTCDRLFGLHIHGNKLPEPMVHGCVDGEYGPDFHLSLSSDGGATLVEGFWSAQWYHPSNLWCGSSSGKLYGSKSQ